MSTQVTRVWWDGDKMMAEPISETEFYKPEPVTEWLTCPKCSHKSPYTPIKAKTLAEDAERITKQARAAIAQMQPAREWVDLTIEDIKAITDNDFGGNRIDCMKAAIKRFKEKNA